jgi:ribosome modulation factor
MAKKAKEAPAPETGHNSGELTASEWRALHFHHFRAIEAQKAVVKAAQAELKTLRKSAKTDGCVMADLDYMARCAELEDPDIVPEELRRRAEIASWFALPVHYQADMFVDRMPLDERAFEEGVATGLAGKDPSPPYDATSSAGQRWMEGWHAGQAQMRDDLQRAMEKKNAQKQRDELIKGNSDADDATPADIEEDA